MGTSAISASAMARCVASASARAGRPAFRERSPHQDVNYVTILGVHADRAAVLAGPQQRPENAAVVQHEYAAVRHEQLERGHALTDQRIHLPFGLIVQVGHDHVKSVIDDRLALGLLHPRLPCVVESLAPVLNSEVDDGRRPAERRRDGAGLEIVGRRRAAERHVKVGMDIDAARQHVFAGSIDHLVGLDVGKARADERDLLVFDQHVAAIAIDGGDDFTIPDEGP
jgi:hypothetical protein